MANEFTYYHASGDYIQLSMKPNVTWKDERQVSKSENHQGITNDPNKCLRVIKVNSYTDTDNVYELNKYMKPDAALDYADTSIVSSCYSYDDGTTTYTDETTDANDADANDVVLMQAAPEVNDALYIACGSHVTGIVMDIGTAGDGTWTITWEYLSAASSWSAFENVDDETDGFTNSGDGQYVTWTIPPDWWYGNVNSDGPYYWIRARVSAYTNIVAQPLGDQIYVLGRYPYCSMWLDTGIGTASLVDFPCVIKNLSVTKSNEDNYAVSFEAWERTL